MKRTQKWLRLLGASVFALTIGAAARAGEIPGICQVGTSDSLNTLRPTFLKVAEDYDRQAAENTEQAERYRSWASAQDMFAGASYGKPYAAIYFADEANRLDAEAAQNRAIAAKYRHLANSKEATKGC